MSKDLRSEQTEPAEKTFDPGTLDERTKLYLTAKTLENDLDNAKRALQLASELTIRAQDLLHTPLYSTEMRYAAHCIDGAIGHAYGLCDELEAAVVSGREAYFGKDPSVMDLVNEHASRS